MLFECIVLTKNNHINAGAFGISEEDGKYNLRVFEDTNTFENLQRHSRFSINYVSWSQLHLLLQCALIGHNDDTQELPPSFIAFWEEIPYLKDTKTVFVEIERREIRELTDWVGSARYMALTCRKVRETGYTDDPISREKQVPILECAVLATKYWYATDNAKVEIRKKVQTMLQEMAGWEDFVSTIKKIVEL